MGGRTLSDIQVTGISRGFDRPDGRLLALNGVDLRLAAGEIGAIIGPNGSGKSTLLRIIGGLLPADAGGVAIDGQPVTGAEPRVGIVFQEPRLLPWRDALGNVTLPLELSGAAAGGRAQRGRELLRLVGVEAFAGARPHELSGGMRQRVALARALALEPSVLLLDEPFSSLDALTRERFQVELLDLWARTRTTILLVTHSIGEAVFLADRVFVLSARPGRVVAEVGIELPRPRQRSSLDVADVGAAAARIRAHLGDPSDTPEAAA